jgi:hypothetical protein
MLHKITSLDGCSRAVGFSPNARSNSAATAASSIFSTSATVAVALPRGLQPAMAFGDYANNQSKKQRVLERQDQGPTASQILKDRQCSPSVEQSHGEHRQARVKMGGVIHDHWKDKTRGLQPRKSSRTEAGAFMELRQSPLLLHLRNL